MLIFSLYVFSRHLFYYCLKYRHSNLYFILVLLKNYETKIFSTYPLKSKKAVAVKIWIIFLTKEFLTYVFIQKNILWIILFCLIFIYFQFYIICSTHLRHILVLKSTFNFLIFFLFLILHLRKMYINEKHIIFILFSYYLQCQNL